MNFLFPSIKNFKKEDNIFDLLDLTKIQIKIVSCQLLVSGIH